MNLKKAILIFLACSLLNAPLTSQPLPPTLAQADCDSSLMFKAPGENAIVTCTWKNSTSNGRLTLVIADWNLSVKSVVAVCNFIPASSDDNNVSRLIHISGSVVKNLSIHENTATFNVLNVKYSIWSSQEIEFEINRNQGFLSHFESAKFSSDDKITCEFNLA